MKAVLISLLLIFNLLHAKVVVIASQGCSISTMTNKDVKHIFMGEKSYIEGNRVIAVDNNNLEVYAQFVNDYLGKNMIQMKVYWTRMIFSGRKKPLKKVDERNLEKISQSEPLCYMTYIKENEIPNYWENINIVP